MKRKILIGIFLILTISFAVLNVCADDFSVEVDYANNKVSVSGSVEEKYADRNVLLIIYNPDFGASDITTNDKSVNWIEQKKVSGDGTYKFDLKLTPDSTTQKTTYKAEVTVDAKTDVFSASFELFNENYTNALKSALKNAVSDGDTAKIKDIIDNYSILLKIDSTDELTYYNSADDTFKENIAKGIIEQDNSDINSFADIFKKCVKIQTSLNTETDVDAYVSLLFNICENISSAVKDTYNSDYFKTSQDFIGTIMNTTYYSPAKLKNDFESALVLKEINKSVLWTDLLSCVDTYSDVLNLDLPGNSYREKVFTPLINKVKAGGYSDTETFESEYKTLLAKYKTPSGGGGGVTSSPVVSDGPLYSNVVSNPVNIEPIAEDEESNEEFKDLEGFEWAKESIIKLKGENIISGYGDKLFRPDQNVTRAEFVKMLVNAYDLKSGETLNAEFDDVSTDDWYYEFVSAAVNCGLVKGVTDKTFEPDEYIKRQDIAVILSRLDGEVSGETKDLGITDLDTVSDYAKASVEKLIDKSILNGYEDHSFRPHNNITRAETAVVIDRAMSAIKYESR